MKPEAKFSITVHRWCIHCMCVCVYMCVWVLKYIFVRNSTVDGSRPSLWNYIAFNSVAIFSVNCFGLEPISAAEFFEALKSTECKISVSYNLYPYISQTSDLTQSPMPVLNISYVTGKFPKQTIFGWIRSTCTLEMKPCDINNSYFPFIQDSVVGTVLWHLLNTNK